VPTPHALRAISVLLAIAAVLVPLTLVPATQGAAPEAATGADAKLTATKLTAGSGRPFRATSPFNVPIGKRVRVDPNSRAMVNVLAGRGYATAQVYADTPPIYHATESTPRHNLNCTEDWGTCDLERMPVPIPRKAVASPGHDRNMVVIDWSTRRAYEFWKYDNNRSTLAWGAVCSIDGNGTGSASSDPCRYGAVGAGVSRLAGVIRTFEIRQGKINHALVGPTGFSCADKYRYPAVKTDGWSTRAGCIPEGARVQLSRSVKCAALSAPRWEKVVCRALQKYGWYNIDNGNVGVEGFGIQFENPTRESDPYAAIGLKDYTQIRHIPLRKLRVLKSWRSFD